MKKLIRITTVPISLKKLLTGQLKFMSEYFHVIAISSNGEKLNEIKKNEGVETFEVNMTRKITPFKDLLALAKLYFFLKKEKPYIVHTHTPKAGLIGMLASRLANVPNRFHTVAGLPLLEATGLKRKLLNFIEKLTYFCATKVYPNSFGLEKIILDENFVEKGKLKVIGNGSSNGIDLDFFNTDKLDDLEIRNVRDKLAITNEDFVYIFVGRIVRDKGVNELVKSFDEISKRNINVKLLLVGPFEEDLDPLDNSVLTIIKNNKKIIPIGYKDDVRPYFSVANLLVFPSYREGFPNVVMQAGAMSLPSIVSNINGCNEIIEEGLNGFIIPPKDQLKLQEVMQFCLLNKDTLVGMGEKARENIKTKYNREIIWLNLLKEYNV